MNITLETIIPILGLIGAIWGLFYTAKQIKHAAQVQRDMLDWNRKKYTEDKLEKKPDIDLTLKLETTFGTKDSLEVIPLESILKAIQTVPEFQLHIRYKLNRYERLARGIRFGVIDEIVVKNALGVHMVKDFLNYANYVQHLQAGNSVGGLEEFSKLVTEWRKNGEFSHLFNYDTRKNECMIIPSTISPRTLDTVHLAHDQNPEASA